MDFQDSYTRWHFVQGVKERALRAPGEKVAP